MTDNLKTFNEPKDIGFFANSITKPPLGLMPKKLHYERAVFERFNEVCEAMTRYYNASQKIPIEWIEEYNELVDHIASINIK